MRLSPLPLYCGEYVPKARRTPLGLTISHKSFVDLQASTHNSLAVNSVPPCCNNLALLSSLCYEKLIMLINNINLWMKMIWTELLLLMKILMVITFLLVPKKG